MLVSDVMIVELDSRTSKTFEVTCKSGWFTFISLARLIGSKL